MKRYKLTDKNMCTYNGTQWEIGVPQKLTIEGNRLCSNNVFHFCHSPEQAVFFNPSRFFIQSPRLFECEAEDIVAENEVKGGCKSLKLTKELPLPEISTEQRVEIAVRCALEVYILSTFVEWAENWLNGKNRSTEAAEDAARTANAYVEDSWAMKDSRAAWVALAARSAALAARAASLAGAEAERLAAAEAERAAAWASRANKTLDLQKIIRDTLGQ
jgi:hypothetical protein